MFEHELQTDRASYARRRCAILLPELLPKLSYSAASRSQSRTAAELSRPPDVVLDRSTLTTHYVPATNSRVYCFKLNLLPLVVGLYHYTFVHFIIYYSLTCTSVSPFILIHRHHRVLFCLTTKVLTPYLNRGSAAYHTQGRGH